MKDLYIKPVVEIKEFDILDVIVTSPPSKDKPGEGSSDNRDPNWSIIV